MAFDSWTALRTAIKDAIADHVAGNPCVGAYRKGNRELKYRTYGELVELLEKTYVLEGLESAGDPALTVSYGRYRRFR